MISVNLFYNYSQEELKGIGDRLERKMEEKDITKNKLKAAGVSRPSIDKILKGVSPSELKKINKQREKDGLPLLSLPYYEQMDYRIYERICNYMGISLEYLLGKVEYSSYDFDYICKYTGLSEAAVRKLHSKKTDPLIPMLLSEYLTKTDLFEKIQSYWSIQPTSSETYSIESVPKFCDADSNTLRYGDTERFEVRADALINGKQKLRELLEEVLLKDIQKELDKYK